MVFGDLEKDAAAVEVMGKALSPSQESVLVPAGPAAAATPEAASAPPKEPPPPDGGTVAWLQVVSATLINAVAWGYPSAYGVFQLYYTDTLGLPAGQVSWVGSVQTFLSYFLSTPAGRLADAGYATETACAGLFLAMLGSFTSSFCTEYWQIFLAQGLCTGAGLGLMYMPSLAVLSSYFGARRSLAMALSAAGTSVGGAVFPAVVQYLIPPVGFPWAVRCCTLLAAVLGTVAVVLLRPRLAPRKSGPLVEWAAFKEPAYALYAAGTFLVFLSLYFYYFYMSSYASEFVGFSDTQSALLLIISSLAGLPTRPLAGWLSDRHLGPLNAFALASLLVGAVGFTWAAVSGRAGMYAFAVAFGLANGASQGAFGGSLASLTADPARMGTRYGMVCTLIGFATLAGPPAAGAIIGGTPGGRYLWAQVWAGAVTVAGAATIALARGWITGPRLRVKV